MASSPIAMTSYSASSIVLAFCHRSKMGWGIECFLQSILEAALIAMRAIASQHPRQILSRYLDGQMGETGLIYASFVRGRHEYLSRYPDEGASALRRFMSVPNSQ